MKDRYSRVRIILEDDFEKLQIARVLLFGVGGVGSVCLDALFRSGVNDITIVDTNGDRLRVLQDKFDLRVVQGHGSHPRVLRDHLHRQFH